LLTVKILSVMVERGQSEQYGRLGQENYESNLVNDPQNVETARTSGEASDNERSDRRGTSNRGFAAMDREKQKRIASEGGRAAHRQGVAHEWSKDEAREAGRKGGQIVSQNREHMSEIGRKGGQSSGQRRQRGGSEPSE
jgi:general stress protein YciG